MKGKVAIVTGGASGLGKSIVTKLAGAGCAVLFQYNRAEEQAAALQRELTAKGTAVAAVHCDFNDPGQVTSFIETDIPRALSVLRPEDPNVDILVNNAGTCEKTFLNRIDEARFLTVMRINYLVPMMLINGLLPRFNRGGRIINITSLMSLYPDSKYIFYGGSKAALNNFSQGIVRDLGHRNITINSIAPGLIATDILKNINNPMVSEFVARNTALKRIGTPEDIANIAFLLSTEDAGWITGQVIEASGGFKIH